MSKEAEADELVALPAVSGFVGAKDAAFDRHRAEDVEAALVREAFQTVLMRQTIEFCAQSVPGYRELFDRYGVTAASFGSPQDLGRFPIVTRQMLADAPELFRSEPGDASFVRSTSGSTGRRLFIYGSQAELDVQQQLALALAGDAAEPHLVLRLTPPVRRLHTAKSADPTLVSFSVAYIPEELPGFWLTHTDFVHELLSGTYPIQGKDRRITTLHITPPYLIEALTANLLQMGVDPHQYGVERVVLTGGHASTRHRELCNRHWGAHCTTNYSCSELSVGFPEAERHPGVYINPPVAMAQVVDPDTGREVEIGACGALVLTVLCPFQTVTPLFRYAPGDVARRLRLPSGRDGFRIIGRQEDCISVSGELFGPSVVLDAVGAFDEIPQRPWPRFNWSVVPGPCGDVVDVEIETTPLTAERAAATGAALGEVLSEALGGARTQVSVHPKGSLARFARIYPAS